MVVAGPQLQTFCWNELQPGNCTQDGRTYYNSFSLNGEHYVLGDCVFLYPEDPAQPPFIARLCSCFHDYNSLSDPHCIEVRWFERLANLETCTHSRTPSEPDGKVAELVELVPELDVNPIGCISGKATVIKARSYAEASKLAPVGANQWFYCSGFYKAATGEFTVYSDLEGEQRQGGRGSKREAHAYVAAAVEEQRGGSRGDAKRLKADAKAGAVGEAQRSGGDASGEEQQRAPKPGGMPGKQCVECGATATPQWREGPHGPKTLCNACGVRYVRAQQRANKRAQQTSARGTPVAVPPPQHKHKNRAETTAPAHVATPMPIKPPTPTPVASEPAHSSLRPVRQAAIAAANKTAAFARTGVFPSSAEELRGAAALVSPQPAAAAAAAAAAVTPVRGSSHDESSHHSTDSAEEVGYEPATAAVVAAVTVVAAAAAAAPKHAEPAPVQQLQSEAAPAATPVPVPGSSGDAACTVLSMQPPLAAMKEEEEQHSLLLHAAEQLHVAEDGGSGSDDVDDAGAGALLEPTIHQSMDEVLKAEPIGVHALALHRPMVEPPAVPLQLPPLRMHHQASQQQQQPHTASTQQGPTSAELRTVANCAATFCPDVVELADLFANYDSLKPQLPHDAITKLTSISDAVKQATNEAATADAALQAVSQVLAERQAAADRARASAVRAIQGMKSYMGELLSQYQAPQPASMWDNSALLLGDLDGSGGCMAENTLIQLDMGPELITVQE